MFDEVRGQVHCPHCGKENEFYEQFKWSDCMLDTYELGDRIPNAYPGYQTIKLENWETKCSSCEKQFRSFCVLRDGVVIGFFNEEEMEHLDEIPTPEENAAKNARYLESCRESLGRSREWEDFKNHPKRIGDTIRALMVDWVIDEIYKVWLSETDEYRRVWMELSGCLGRISTDVYVYKVHNAEKGDRFLIVEDRENWSLTLDGFKNMELRTKYECEKGYSIKQIF